MRTYFLVTLLQISSVLAWRVDRRCLEGELLVGDEADYPSLETGELDAERQEIDLLSVEDFEWNDLAASGFEEEKTTNLRGRNQATNGNDTVAFSNTTRSLQSGRTFNLKLTWERGACWQGA